MYHMLINLSKVLTKVITYIYLYMVYVLIIPRFINNPQNFVHPLPLFLENRRWLIIILLNFILLLYTISICTYVVAYIIK